MTAVRQTFVLADHFSNGSTAAVMVVMGSHRAKTALMVRANEMNASSTSQPVHVPSRSSPGQHGVLAVE